MFFGFYSTCVQIPILGQSPLGLMAMWVVLCLKHKQSQYCLKDFHCALFGCSLYCGIQLEPWGITAYVDDECDQQQINKVEVFLKKKKTLTQLVDLCSALPALVKLLMDSETNLALQVSLSSCQHPKLICIFTSNNRPVFEMGHW